MTRTLPVFLRKLTINQLLLFTHIILVMAVIIGLTYSRFVSEWEHQLDDNAFYIQQSLEKQIDTISEQVTYRQYEQIKDVTVPTLNNTISNLVFAEIKQPENGLHIRYFAEKNQFWRADTHNHGANRTNKKDQITTRQREGRVALENASAADLRALSDRRVFNLAHQPELEVAWTLDEENTRGYWMSDSKCTLHVKVPLDGLTQGYVWLVIDASDLSSIHKALLVELLCEAVLALILSMILIAFVSRWVVVPLKNLSDTMTQQVSADALEYMPELKRNDEIGDLARAYKGLLTKIENQLSLLQTQSDTDPLTGLGSRYKYTRMSVPFVEQYRKQGDCMAVLICDIDNFKAYNDRYGHTAGDNALARVARTIDNTLHANDLAFRFGGEEFVVLVARKSIDELQLATETLHSAVEKLDMVHSGNAPFDKVTVSIGAAMCCLEKVDLAYPSGELLELLFEQADLSLYHCKNSGRNQVKTEVW